MCVTCTYESMYACTHMFKCVWRPVCVCVWGVRTHACIHIYLSYYCATAGSTSKTEVILRKMHVTSVDTWPIKSLLY